MVKACPLIAYIDKLTWSKLETGRLPSAEEVKALVQDVMGPKALFDIDAEPDDSFAFSS